MPANLMTIVQVDSYSLKNIALGMPAISSQQKEYLAVRATPVYTFTNGTSRAASPDTGKFFESSHRTARLTARNAAAASWD